MNAETVCVEKEREREREGRNEREKERRKKRSPKNVQQRARKVQKFKCGGGTNGQCLPSLTQSIQNTQPSLRQFCFGKYRVMAMTNAG
jgi:hypothetical protein